MAEVLAALADGAPLARDRVLRGKVGRALDVLDRTLELYGPSHVAISFNGGKDSTVLLHLLRATVARRGEAAAGRDLGAVRALVFERPDDFPEVAAFVAAADAAHGLGLHRVTGPMGEGLAAYLEGTGVGAIVLGTRAGDPNAAGQDTFCPSSPGWPPFMRVNPILAWGYGDVWAFLDGIGAAYCSLYDRGFTSVGSAPSTRPNSALRRPDGTYAPARALADGRAERAGRTSAAPTPRGTGGGRQPVGATPRALTRSAAVLVVGDELLAGRVSDVNGGYVCAGLRAIGWSAARVALLPDDEAAIAAELTASLDAHGVALVCGGVGPTPDDRTMAAIARAFGVPLARDADLEARLRAYFGRDRVSDAHLKMADVPACDRVEAIDVAAAADGTAASAVDGGAAAAAAAAAAAGPASPPRSPFPLVALTHAGSTVYVLPGVPFLLKRKWPALAAHLTAATGGPLAPYRSVALSLAVDDESLVGPALDAVTEAAGGGVAAGSYPVAPRADGTTVVLLLESKDGAALAAGLAAAKEALAGAGVVVVGEETGETCFLKNQPSL